MADCFTSSITDIAPPNISSDLTFSPVITALDPHIQLLTKDSLQPQLLSQIDTLPDNVLDLLALQFHADFYDLAPNTDLKRRHIHSSLPWHMKKGTAHAIIAALKYLGIDAEFIPWWEFDGRPYTFRIKADITDNVYWTIPDAHITSLITRAVNEAKSARSLMVSLDTSFNFTDIITINASAVSGFMSRYSLRNSLPEYPDDTRLFYGISLAKDSNIRLGINRDFAVKSSLYTANIISENWSDNLGVDLDTMQELLLQFERRIFNRMDAQELRAIERENSHYSELNSKIDWIIDQLRWKGPDESL